MSTMTTEATRALNFLARMPRGHTTLERADVKDMLLQTGGNILACGSLYNIKATHIGAGVYKVSLELSNP